MKSILLTTTALVAFAGAAAAEVSFTGNTTLGYNNYEPEATDIVDNDDEQGFYWTADVDVDMSAALDNGLTAAASFELDIVDDLLNGGQLVASDEFVLSLTSATAGLYFGDTAFAADSKWVSAGDMEADGFSENDGETVLRGEVSVAGIDAAVSYAVTSAGNDTDGVQSVEGVTAGASSVDQLSLGASAEFGMVSVVVAYQEEADAAFGAVAAGDNADYNVNEIFGVSAGFAVAGADITVAYASNQTTDVSSTGVKVAYPFGPVTATAYYVAEAGGLNEDPNMGLNIAYSDGPIAAKLDLQDDQGVSKWAAEGSYNVGNGMTVYAGMVNENEADDAAYYVAGVYDLGGGAEVLVSYGVDASGGQGDEIGANEYQAGTTVEVSFSF